MSERRIAWAITGAGHALEESIDLILKIGNVDVFLSRAADEVLGIYKLDGRLNTPGLRIYRESKASAPLVGRLFNGKYPVLVIAPATSNSVAKFVHGISDTLVTNLFAQAGKSHVPIIVYPTDIAPDMDSKGPHRDPLKVYPRPVDLENTANLGKFSGVTVVKSSEDLAHALREERYLVDANL